MRSVLVVGGSVFLSSLVIANAYYQRKQFYPSVVYITKSNPSMAVLALQAFVLVMLVAKVMRKVFFGQLRVAETEHLIERSWYAVTETCLAFTVFREDFSPKFIAFFTLLLFFKSFHWLCEDRIDFMERSPAITALFHVRALSLIGLLGCLDYFFISRAIASTMQQGPTVQLVFGFEYSILLTCLVTVLIKYILHVIDLQSENPWENKVVYLLYLELVTNFLKLILYLAFVILIVKVQTFPLFAIRPMYLTIRSFKKALNDVIMSRRAIRNMNTLYPDATEEEMASGDVCIICREGMSGVCKKLPCNHIFHASCLRSWFQRQQSCPICRLEVLRAPAPPPVPQQQQQQMPQQPDWQQIHRALFAGFPPMQGGLPPPAGGVPPAAAQAMGGQGGAAGGNPGAHLPFIIPNFAQPQPGQGPAQPGQAQQGPGAPRGRAPAAGGGAQPTTGAAAPPHVFLQHSVMAQFYMPPPPPPADLSALTDAELQQMESCERLSVEMRIRWLRDIQTLMDAAVEQMNQYATVMGALQAGAPRAQPLSSSASPPSGTSQTPAAAAPSGTTESAASAPPSSSSPPAPSPSASIPQSPRAGPSSSSSTNKTSQSAVSGPSTATSSGSGARTEHVSSQGAASKEDTPESPSGRGPQSEEANEMRRRRLEKFAQPPATNGAEQ